MPFLTLEEIYARLWKNEKLYDYLKEYGNIENAMNNGDALSKMADDNPHDKIAYSQVAKVFRLLEQIKREQGR